AAPLCPPTATLFPYTTLFRSKDAKQPSLGPLGLAKLTEFFLRPAECFLNKVLGIRGRAAQPVGVAIKRLVMLVDQRLHFRLAAKIGRAPSELQSLAYLVCRLL